jgi:uncharacterized YigZ family protein
MDETEKIFEIEKNLTNKIKLKGSQFIGYGIKIISVKNAEDELNLIKKKYFDATHHCYAYKLNSGEEKYSDDGEPSGTAGVRILNTINHYDLTNLIIVIVRYFGGTKLGVGPLGKAYADTSLSLLQEARILTKIRYEQLIIRFGYDYLSPVHYLINKYECKKISNLFEESPLIKCYLEPSKIKDFENELIEKTSGNATLEPLNKDIYLTLK